MRTGRRMAPRIARRLEPHTCLEGRFATALASFHPGYKSAGWQPDDTRRHPSQITVRLRPRPRHVKATDLPSILPSAAGGGTMLGAL